MTNRITASMINSRLERLNQLTNSPASYSTDGKINIGFYHLYQASGLSKLSRTCNESGAIQTIQPSMGTKRETYDFINAYIAGYAHAKNANQ